MTKEIPPDEEWDRLYMTIGRGLSRWNKVEAETCRIFRASVGDPPWPSAELAFWEVRSFENKLDMTDKAVNAVLVSVAEHLEDWTQIYCSVKKKLRIRNKLAHGSVYFRRDSENPDGLLALFPYDNALTRTRQIKRLAGQLGIPIVKSQVRLGKDAEPLRENDILEFIEDCGNISRRLTAFRYTLDDITTAWMDKYHGSASDGDGID